MNSSRLVAALAAIAVGFGVTLVGVAAADDADPDDSTEAADTVSETISSTSVESAESAAATTPVTETSPAESAPAEDDAAETESAEPTPTDTARSQSSRTDPVDAEQAQGETPPAPRPDTAASEFPCSEEAFESLFAELTAQEQTALIEETDVFVRVIAKRLAAIGTNTVDEWEGPVGASFTTFTADCAPEDERVFLSGPPSQFFCSAARVSADDGLFTFFGRFVPAGMTACVPLEGRS